MWDKLKDRLVDDWCHAWRWWSMRLNAVGVVILSWVSFDPVGALAVWNMMPAPVRAVLPTNFLTFAGLALFGLSMMARMVKQPPKASPNGQ